MTQNIPSLIATKINKEIFKNGRENIMLPVAIHNMMGKEDEKRIDEIIKYLEIEEVIEKFPSEMSGDKNRW